MTDMTGHRKLNWAVRIGLVKIINLQRFSTTPPKNLVHARKQWAIRVTLRREQRLKRRSTMKVLEYLFFVLTDLIFFCREYLCIKPYWAQTGRTIT